MTRSTRWPTAMAAGSGAAIVLLLGLQWCCKHPEAAALEPLVWSLAAAIVVTAPVAMLWCGWLYLNAAPLQEATSVELFEVPGGRVAVCFNLADPARSRVLPGPDDSDPRHAIAYGAEPGEAVLVMDRSLGSTHTVPWRGGQRTLSVTWEITAATVVKFMEGPGRQAGREALQHVFASWLASLERRVCSVLDALLIEAARRGEDLDVQKARVATDVFEAWGLVMQNGPRLH